MVVCRLKIDFTDCHIGQNACCRCSAGAIIGMTLAMWASALILMASPPGLTLRLLCGGRFIAIYLNAFALLIGAKRGASG